MKILNQRTRGAWLTASLLFALALCPQAFAETVTNTYDALNRLTSVVYGNGQQITYTYDAAGNRLTMNATAPTGPDAFSFTPQTDVALNAPVTSNAITVAGSSTTTLPITITGGEYSINGGSFTAAPSTVSNGQTVTVRLTSAATYSTKLTATLNIGGVSGSFLVTTLAGSVPTPTLDTDGDGMSDKWELAHSLDPYLNDAAGDLDGDGYTNAQEYAAGTDPANDLSKPDGAKGSVLFQDNFDNLIYDDRWILGVVGAGAIYTLTEDGAVLQSVISKPMSSCVSLSLQSFATVNATNAAYRAKLNLDGYGTTAVGLMKGTDLLNRIEVHFDADKAPHLHIRSWDAGVATEAPAAIPTNYKGTSLELRLVKTGAWYKVYVNNLFQGSINNYGLGDSALRPYLALESCPDNIALLDSKFDLIEVLPDFPPPLLGDMDGSGRVDGFDLGRLGLAFGSQPGDAHWNFDADLNGDGVVDGSDFTLLGANFGKTK